MLVEHAAKSLATLKLLKPKSGKAVCEWQHTNIESQGQIRAESWGGLQDFTVEEALPN